MSTRNADAPAVASDPDDRRHTSPGHAHTADHRSWVRTTWPVDGRAALRFVVVLVALVGVFTAVGLVLTDLLAPNAITEADAELADRFASGRTPTNDDLAHWGAMLAATEVKIGVTAVIAVAALARWRRWHEAVYLATTLVLEATAFIVVTFIVARPRPDVPRLEDSPVNSSFPSGHVAAATVYGAFVVLVFWHTRSRWARSAAAALFAAVVVVVAWARMYQGMHYLSDVIAGVVLGLCSLVLCRWILGPPPGVVSATTSEHDLVADAGRPVDT